MRLGRDVPGVAVAPDGTVWLGASTIEYHYWSSHASRFDGETWTSCSTAEGLAGVDVRAVAVSSDGAVWFGTGAGASRYLPIDSE